MDARDKGGIDQSCAQQDHPCASWSESARDTSRVFNASRVLINSEISPTTLHTGSMVNFWPRDRKCRSHRPVGFPETFERDNNENFPTDPLRDVRVCDNSLRSR